MINSEESVNIVILIVTPALGIQPHVLLVKGIKY